MPPVLWADSPVSRTLADNLQRFGRARGMENWNQMATRFRDWSLDKPFVEPISVNTLRNIAKRENAPHVSKLVLLADFLEVPAYALFIPDCPPAPDLVMALNALVAAYVNGDGNTREAIHHMLKAIQRPSSSDRAA